MEREDVKLNKLLAEAWEYKMKENPLYATFCGERRYNDKLPSATAQDYQRRLNTERSLLQRLYTIEKGRLSAEDKINYHIFESVTRDQISEYEFKSYLMPVTKKSGPHIFFPQLPTHIPLDTLQDYENYIARLYSFQSYMEQNIALMKIGIQENYVVPKAAITGCEDTIKSQIVDDPTTSPLYRVSFPMRISNSDQNRLRQEIQKAISTSVIPAYRQFLEFMQTKYVPVAQEKIGVSALPNGRKFYQFLVHHYTTLKLSPEEVHDIGIKEVCRIRVEMDDALRQLKFNGSFSQFVESLKGDPRFYVTNPVDLLREACYILKRMEGELPRLFKTLPRIPCGVKEVPDYMASAMPCAYYMPPTGDGSKAGCYYVNTSNLESRPLYELEPLSLHESVPGHHLQLALQQELKDLPQLRRFIMFSSFNEGWALYAERLGMEVGFYRDPYRNFARLAYEIWRACRLVVDTGIHYFGWSRQQAINYMVENTPLTYANIVSEVDRYIAVPGQALAYKIGELEFGRLRSKAESRLGNKFDIREFHDAVLCHGSIPLNLLSDMVDNYIDKECIV